MLVIFAKAILTIDFPKQAKTASDGILETVCLSLVQGLTEWFPISSTGHLVMVQEMLGIHVSVAFDITLHLGTLIGVVLFLRKDLQSILRTLCKLDFSSEKGRMLIYLVLGTIPMGLAGFFLKSFFESMFKSLFAVGIAMVLNGLILFSTKHAKPRKRLNALDSFLIGVSQAAAITPGISRTGITVSTGLLLGIESDEAYRFSLFLSIPSIIGGSLVKLQEVSFEQEYWMIALGILMTAVFGYLALVKVRKYIVKQSFHKFAYYCLLVGAVILLLSILQIF
ncbi:MAG: undecaprenyl-diphosphate phosphatase [Crenarchaeota archaeon]|nr:undecaprenyl-diphosphate phosphatase [Thermoproteota archaeon]